MSYLKDMQVLMVDLFLVLAVPASFVSVVAAG